MNRLPAVEVVAALDVGGTRIKAALVDRDLSPVLSLVLPTPPDLASALVPTVAATVERLGAEAAAAGVSVAVRGCGLVVPGLVDEPAGVGLLSVNLGWKDLPIREPVAAALGLPTVLGHDVRAGLRAEVRLGAARGARHALFMPLGTGIAGALMLDGRVITADGWAGELGHVVVDPRGPLCNCGNHGCLEAIGSASAIERAYADRTGRPVGAEQVAALVAAGDPDATAVWSGAVDALALTLANVVSTTGVDLVVVGGGLSRSGPILMDPLALAVRRRITFQRPPRLVLAELGDRAGCLGAACLAWDAR
jgi:glucokinase